MIKLSIIHLFKKINHIFAYENVCRHVFVNVKFFTKFFVKMKYLFCEIG